MKAKSEKKIFMWFATGAYGKETWPGPHYLHDQKKIGRKLTHTLDELLQMDVSNAIKKKLTNAKPGSSVRIHELHANGSLYVKRLSQEKIDVLDDFKKVYKKLNKTFELVKTLKAKKDKLQSSLFKK